MAKALWHYTDRKTGKRTEVWLDDLEREIDAQTVLIFEALQIDVSQDKFPSRAELSADARVGLILANADKLPPLKRQHWREELERLGVTLPAPKAKPVPVKSEGKTI